MLRFNRASVVSMSALGLAWPLAAGGTLAGLELGTGLLAVILASVLVSLLWLGLFRRQRRTEPQETAMPSTKSADSPEATCCQFSRLPASRKPAEVAVDRSQNSICFKNCLQPRELLGTTAPEFGCPLDDIVVVYTYYCRGCQVLKIVTVHGTALVTARSAVGFDKLREALSSYAQPNRPGYALENPRLNGPLGLALFCGAVAGVLAVQGLVPRAASTGTVALAMLGGGLCGLMAISLIMRGLYGCWCWSGRR